MSYHGEMHYNSVRQADDFNTMVPPVPIMLRTPSGGAAGGGVLGTADEPEESEVRQQAPQPTLPDVFFLRRTPTPHTAHRTPHAAHARRRNWWR